MFIHYTHTYAYTRTHTYIAQVWSHAPAISPATPLSAPSLASACFPLQATQRSFQVHGGDDPDTSALASSRPHTLSCTSQYDESHPNSYLCVFASPVLLHTCILHLCTPAFASPVLLHSHISCMNALTSFVLLPAGHLSSPLGPVCLNSTHAHTFPPR